MKSELLKNAKDCFAVRLEDGITAMFEDMDNAATEHIQCGIGDGVKPMKAIPLKDYLAIKEVLREIDDTNGVTVEDAENWIHVICGGLTTIEFARNTLDEFEKTGEWNEDMRKITKAIVEPYFDDPENEWQAWEDFMEKDINQWAAWIRNNIGEVWGDVADVVVKHGY